VKLPALIFDFGNVVAHFDYRRTCERLAIARGLKPQQLYAAVGELSRMPFVGDYECGKLSSEAFAQLLCARARLQVPFDEFARAWSEIFELNEPIAQLVAALKRNGYTLVLGSNTNALHAAHFRRQFSEALSHFDRMVLSYEIGAAKPARDFYLACAQAAGAPPASCLFIDDLAQNVEGARAAGLRAVQYRDPASLSAQLRELGIDADLPFI
jgi:putative hydrolase of the HAD superfamily